MARRTVETKIEVFPEADQLANYPHPRATETLYGHKAARAELATAIDTGSMHHAWLLTGKEGIGKATLAYKAAVYALADPGERMPALDMRPGTLARRQVLQLSHPGLLVIRRSYDIKAKRFPTAITVDEVRKLRSFLSHRNAPGQWRVVIIDRADELNINAANALLKSLEEPPSQTVFFLIAVDTGKLLPTIRSRCRLLGLGPLANADLIAAADAAHARLSCDEEKHPLPNWQELAAAAAGSPRRLLALACENGAEITRAIDRIYGTLAKPDIVFQHTLADKLTGNQSEQDYQLFVTLLLERLADLIKTAAMQPMTEGKRPSAGLIQPDKLPIWADLWETLQREERNVRALNLDRGAFLLEVFNRLERAAKA